MAAVTPALLQQNNITSVSQLSRVAPSLTIVPGQSAGRAVSTRSSVPLEGT